MYDKGEGVPQDYAEALRPSIMTNRFRGRWQIAFQQTIRQVSKRAGMTQTQLSEKLAKPQSYVRGCQVFCVNGLGTCQTGTLSPNRIIN